MAIREEIVEKIGRRRRQILVHSCIYYRLNSSIVEDYVYDMWAKELAKLQEENEEEAAAAPLAEEFKAFDAESITGFMLPVHDPRTVANAQALLDYHIKQKKTARSL